MAPQITLSSYLTRVGLMCVVPTLLFSVWLGVSDFRYLSKERDAEMHDLARLAAIKVQTEIEARITRLRALQVATDTVSKRSQQHESLKAFDAAFGSPIALLSANRRMIMHSRVALDGTMPSLPAPGGPSVLDFALAQNTPQVGDLIKSPTDGSPILPVVVPFIERGEPLAWATSIRSSDLALTLRDSNLPPGWGLALVDGLGAVVTQHGTEIPPADRQDSRRNIRQPVGDTRLSVALHVTPFAFHGAALATPLTRGAVLLLLMGAVLAYIRHHSIQFHRAAGRLTQPMGAAPGDDAPPSLRIAEFDAASDKIDRLDRALQRASDDQQAAKDRHIRQLQKVLRVVARSDARMKAIFDGASEGVAIVSDDLRVIRCNPTFAGMLGETPSGIRNAPLLDYSLPEHRDKHREIFAMLRRDAQSTGYSKYRGTVRVALKDGHRFTSESYVACMRVDAEIVFLMMARDVTERIEQEKRLEHALADLSASHQALRQAHATIHVSEQRERERVSRDLHDGLQQALAALKIELELTDAHLHSGKLDAAQSGVDRAKGMASSLIDEIHRIVNDLHPRVLEELGLVAALEQLSLDFSLAQPMDVEFQAVGDPAALSGLTPPMASALYRVTQECFNNVRKHADASFVYCELNVSDPLQIVLQVSDDGRGFDSDLNTRQGSHGVLGMAQRVRMLGGRIEFSGTRLQGIERGATVVVTVPLRS